jgi:predicted RNase H-like HicB family nuclease
MNSMTTRDFKVFLEPDEEYGGYVVVCPSIPGCYSQGKSVSEAFANSREAIELCLEDMESRGEEIPDPSELLVGSVVVTRRARSSPLFRAKT